MFEVYAAKEFQLKVGQSRDAGYQLIVFSFIIPPVSCPIPSGYHIRFLSDFIIKTGDCCFNIYSFFHYLII